MDRGGGLKIASFALAHRFFCCDFLVFSEEVQPDRRLQGEEFKGADVGGGSKATGRRPQMQPLSWEAFGLAGIAAVDGCFQSKRSMADGSSHAASPGILNPRN